MIGGQHTDSTKSTFNSKLKTLIKVLEENYPDESQNTIKKVVATATNDKTTEMKELICPLPEETIKSLFGLLIIKTYKEGRKKKQDEVIKCALQKPLAA